MCSHLFWVEHCFYDRISRQSQCCFLWYSYIFLIIVHCGVRVIAYFLCIHIHVVYMQLHKGAGGNSSTLISCHSLENPKEWMNRNASRHQSCHQSIPPRRCCGNSEELSLRFRCFMIITMRPALQFHRLSLLRRLGPRALSAQNKQPELSYWLTLEGMDLTTSYRGA